jgi:hypothetical protein
MRNGKMFLLAGMKRKSFGAQQRDNEKERKTTRRRRQQNSLLTSTSTSDIAREAMVMVGVVLFECAVKLDKILRLRRRRGSVMIS